MSDKSLVSAGRAGTEETTTNIAQEYVMTRASIARRIIEFILERFLS
jgi:hypothetical protein